MSTTDSLADPLTRKLRQFTRLSPDDERALGAMAREGMRGFGARENLVREGGKPGGVRLVLSGWAGAGRAPRGRDLAIPDLDALQAAAQFNPNYLHLDREGRPHDANEG